MRTCSIMHWRTRSCIIASREKYTQNPAATGQELQVLMTGSLTGDGDHRPFVPIELHLCGAYFA